MQKLGHRTGYKQTEIGEVPVDWQIVSLKEAAQAGADTFVDGPFGSDLKVSDYTNSGIMLIQLQNVGDGIFYFENKKYTSESKYQQLLRHATQPGDIVISKMSDPVGRACIIPPVADRLLVVSDCVKLRSDENKFDKIFLLHAINSPPVRKQAIEKSMGTTRLRIRLTELKGLKIPFPSLKEQRKIASILSKVDELIQTVDHVIEQTQRLKKGLMQKLLTKGIGHTKFRETTIGKIPVEWTVKRLGEVLNLCQYGLSLPLLGQGQYPIFRMNNIENGYMVANEMKFIDLDKSIFERYKLEKDDPRSSKKKQNSGGGKGVLHIKMYTKE